MTPLNLQNLHPQVVNEQILKRAVVEHESDCLPDATALLARVEAAIRLTKTATAGGADRGRSVQRWQTIERLPFRNRNGGEVTAALLLKVPKRASSRRDRRHHA